MNLWKLPHECLGNDYRQRFLAALQYYSRFNIDNNDSDAEIVRVFMHDMYHELINDYVHFHSLFY